MGAHVLSKKGRRFLLNQSAVNSSLNLNAEGVTINFTGNATRSLNGSKTVITFNGNGSLYVTSSGTVEFLMVGAGGGGSGGGGGAGGLIYIPAYTLTSSAYPIVIGSGSVGTNGTTNSNIPGSNTTFALFTAYGGGHGARSDGGNTTQANGKNGGCGSGAGPSVYVQSGGTASYAAQYNTGSGGGGSNNAGGNYNAGGGGGAGAIGSAGLAAAPGIGGNGLQFSINGTSSYYAGGGGGGSYFGATVASGGLGGGGGGGSLNGQANTGGGGAGNAPNTGVGGTGGSGVFIISY
jgi:hypothetical protein